MNKSTGIKIPCQVKNEDSAIIFSRAICRLRERLGITQEAMARRLDMSTRGYCKWESGENKPRGKNLLKLLAMAPDDEMLSMLGMISGAQTPAPDDRAASEKRGGTMTPAQLELRGVAQMAHQGIDILYKLARQGDGYAEECLRSTLANINACSGRASQGPSPKPPARKGKI